MDIKHKYDHYGRKEPSPIYIAKPGKRIICALNGVDDSSVSLTVKTNNTAELTFTVDKYIQDVLTDGYEYLDEQMELYCSGIWFKIWEPPIITNDGLRETKEITADSYEIMLSQYQLNDFFINTGSEESYEMQYQKTHDQSKFYQVKFYDPDNPMLSFLDLILYHADVPGWKIGYVDDITPDDEGILLPNSICNFEVDEKSVYSFLTQEVSPAHKCVFEFDTKNLLINVYRPDSIGKDTNIVLGFRNIQDKVTITREENLVTQYYVEGLDGYNIESVNFGIPVITDLSYFCKEPYMNAALQEKYKAWVRYRESRRDEYIKLSKAYNGTLDVLSELEYRVPLDSAANNWFSCPVDDLKTAYDENTAIVRGLESLYVDEENNFDLEALKVSSDWSLYESLMNYTIPSIVAALQAKDETIEGYGKGNYISNINPVVLGEDWLCTSATPYQLTDAPAYGITRGISVQGNLIHKDITVEYAQEYVLSCFAKGSGSINLEYGSTGQNRTAKSFELTDTWTRIYVTFTAPSKIISVAFSGLSFDICGMQLEMGNRPSQFGYFTQEESVLKAYETDWKLYGIKELKNKLDVYQACIDELKKNGYADPYSPLSQYEEYFHTQMHQKYLDYLALKNECEKALAERQAEYDKINNTGIQELRKQIAQDVLIENFGNVQNEFPPFSPLEIYIIKSLYNQATYINENIITTTLDSVVDAVDKQKVFYNDAVQNLYVDSHPQYTYTDDVNNIYALSEFQDFHDDLQVNNFIRLGLSDTKYVKLRVTEITYNPCTLDETMEITFSSMIQYKGKRNDYNEITNNTIDKASRNGGHVSSITKSDTAEYVFTADAIKKLFSNPVFNSMLGGATVGGTGSGGTVTADAIIAELVKADKGVFKELTADTAFIKYIESQLITSDKVVTSILEADKATIEQLSVTLIEANEINADVANITKLLSGYAGIGDLQTINLTADNVTINDAVIKELIASRISVADLMAHSATAQLITLISANGKPTIAFKDSTQQFYDSNGNVRVQIGQDGNGNFNFIVREEDGTTALFDSTGIHREAIPNGTIINDMIETNTISKDKLGFQMVEPNEFGGIDITQIYDGEGNKWGILYEQFKEETGDSINEVRNITDTLNGEILQRVKQTDYDADQESISTRFSEINQNVSGISLEVSSMRTDFDEKITANSTKINQTADTLSLIASGDGESSLVLTDNFISLVSDNIGIKGDVRVDGIVQFFNTDVDGKYTTIKGGLIETNSIITDSLAADAIRSKIYENGDTSKPYSAKGIWFDLTGNGAIRAKNFAIDNEGNAYFKGNGEFEGTIIANQGKIGSFNIDQAIWYGMESLSSKNNGVYLGSNGIGLGGGKFKVTSDGKLYASDVELTGKIYATDGTFSGTITGSTIRGNNIEGGTISGATISGNTISGGTINGTTITGTDIIGNTITGGSIEGTSISIGGNFNVDTDGKADLSQLLIKECAMVGRSWNDWSYFVHYTTTNKLPTVGTGIGGGDGDVEEADSNLPLLGTTVTSVSAIYLGKIRDVDGVPDYSFENTTNNNWGNGYFLCRSDTNKNSNDGFISTGNLYSNGYKVSTSNHTHSKILFRDSSGTSIFGLALKYTSGATRYICPTDGTAKAGTANGIVQLGSPNNQFSAFYVNAIGSNSYRVQTLHVEEIDLGGIKRTTWPSGSDGSESITLKIAGTTRTGTNFSSYNLALYSHKHSSNDINWATEFGYKGLGHIHTIIMNSNKNMSIAITNDSIPALAPYAVSGYSNPDSFSLNQGGTLNLGNSSHHFHKIFVDEIVLNSGTSENGITSWSGLGGNSGGGITNASIGEVKTGNAGTSASATVTVSGNTAIFNFTIPRGATGATGAAGSSTPSQVIASDGETRSPITTGIGSTQKVAYITANNTSRLNVFAQFGQTSYSTSYIALTSSDIRLKTNIKNTNINGLSLINSIKIRQFNWIKDNQYQKIGVIADELELLDKNLVFGGGYDEDGTMNIKSINTFYLQGYEIKAIQELSAINNVQSEEISSLKSQLKQTQNDNLTLQGELAILKQKMQKLEELINVKNQ